MERSWITRLILGSCLCLLSMPGQTTTDPIAFLRNIADYVIDQIETRRAELEQDSSQIYSLVETRIVPHFDFHMMSRSAAGRHWRKATESQKQRLARQFQELLVRTYALSMLSYSGQKVEYLPLRGDPTAQRVVVNTRVLSDGPQVPVDYRLYMKDGEWLIYDVIVDGVSLVANYRSSFGAEIGRGGIDGLITTLAEKNRKFGEP